MTFDWKLKSSLNSDKIVQVLTRTEDITSMFSPGLKNAFEEKKITILPQWESLTIVEEDLFLWVGGGGAWGGGSVFN